jgi:hypothetical protein
MIWQLSPLKKNRRNGKLNWWNQYKPTHYYIYICYIWGMSCFRLQFDKVFCICTANKNGTVTYIFTGWKMKIWDFSRWFSDDLVMGCYDDL